MHAHPLLRLQHLVSHLFAGQQLMTAATVVLEWTPGRHCYPAVSPAVTCFQPLHSWPVVGLQKHAPVRAACARASAALPLYEQQLAAVPSMELCEAMLLQ